MIHLFISLFLMHIFHVGAFFGHSGRSVQSESFDVTLAAVWVQVPILEGQKLRVWNVVKILQVLPWCPYALGLSLSVFFSFSWFIMMFL